MNGIHLINHSQDGVTIHFYMLLIFSLLQLALKQQAVLAHESSGPAPSEESPQTPTPIQPPDPGQAQESPQTPDPSQAQESIQTPDPSQTQELVQQSQHTSKDIFHNIPSKNPLSHPYHFFEMIGEKLKIYWKIGIHWLSILRSILPQPFNDRALELLGSG